MNEWMWALLFAAALWAGYFYLRQKSRDLGIVYNPFQRPAFYLCLAYTCIILFGLFSLALQAWLVHDV